MDRHWFGEWGLELDDDGFAQALAGLGTSLSMPTPDVPDAETEPIVFRCDRVWHFIGQFTTNSYYRRGNASSFRDAWRGNAGLGPRIEIVVERLQPEEYGLFDLLWFVEQLSRSAVGAKSVYVRQDNPSHPVSWHWPLRIGLLPGEREDVLRSSLGSGAPNRLVEFVDIGLTRSECDLLLLPYNPRTGLAKVLGAAARITADCVLVLGGFNVDNKRAYELARALRSEVRTSGVAVLSVPKEMRAKPGKKRKQSWLGLLVTHLSHNEPLDTALFSANRELGLRVPYLAASRSLVELAHLEVSTARLALQIQEIQMSKPVVLDGQVANRLRLPARGPAQKLGDVLLNNIRSYDWKRESGDATSVVRLRRTLERHIGAPIRLGSAMAEPPLGESTLAIRLEQEGSVPVEAAAPAEAALTPATLPEVLTDSSGRGGEAAAEPAGIGAEGWEEAEPGAFGEGEGETEEAAAGGEEIGPSVPTVEADLLFDKAAAGKFRKTASRPPERRHLQAQILQATAEGRFVPVESALAPNKSYAVKIRIAVPDRGWEILPEVFRSEKLPPSSSGHILTVAFCELRGADNDKPSGPQLAEIHLPATQDSTSCRFFIRTRENQTVFRARIIVLFQGRVLQTAILTAGVVPERGRSEKTIALDLENVVRPVFDQLTASREFDAAIVLNHAQDGVPGATVVTPHAAQFLEPRGLQESLKAFKDILAKVTALNKPPASLSDPALLDVLRQLANHGCLIWRLFSKECGLLANARRIQVVEAVSGAFLPVEFFYDGLAPKTPTTLCDHAAAALAASPDDAPCPRRDNDQFTCPTDFWSFNRVIERRAHSDLPYGKLYELSEPSTRRPKLDVLSQAVVATSAKVSRADAKKLLQLVSAVCGRAVMARDFDDLVTKVQGTSPTLIVLLPHSLNDPNTILMAALELGGKIVNSAQINTQHALGPKSQTGPVVLLLGCSTELVELSYQTFVESFKGAGASLVLATMSPIRGQHAVKFVERFLAELKNCVAAGNHTFGDALLSTKRQMLAAGDPFVLTLSAYGDAEWLI